MKKKRLLTGICVCSFMLAVVVFLALSFYRKDWILCPFRNLTGLSCPGCGNTRLVTELMKGNVLKALSYNYYFVAELFYILWVLVAEIKEKRRSGRFHYESPCKAVDYTVLCGLLLWWVIRNILKI